MNCTFCGHDIFHGREKIFVSRKGEIFYFCSKKCEKNLLKLKRKPRKTRWTQAYWEEKEIRIKSKPVEVLKKEVKEKKTSVETVKKEEKRVEKTHEKTAEKQVKHEKKEKKPKTENKQETKTPVGHPKDGEKPKKNKEDKK